MRRANRRKKEKGAEMGKRKSRHPSDNPETLIPKLEEDDRSLPNEVVAEKGGNGFFACYLLTSLSPRHKGQTYIGFTVNPRRRIRQHNGEIGSGAGRTKSKRPWEMVLCIYGFPTNVAALQFEWAWQHPVESLAVRKAAVEFKSLNGLPNKIKLAYTMLTLPSWQSLNLTINFFSTKYTKHYAGCPSLPKQMKVQVRSMDELPCYTGIVDMDEKDLWDDDDEDCDGIDGPNILLKGLENVSTVHDFSGLQSSINEASTPPRGSLVQSEGRRWSFCPTVHDFSGPQSSINEASTPPRGSPVQSEGRRRSLCSTEKRISLFCNGSYSRTSDSPSIEKCTIELDSPDPQTFLVSTSDNEQLPPVQCPAEHCPVEVIDVFSPSPEYTSVHRKRRSVSSSVCPQIIDLTESPI